MGSSFGSGGFGSGSGSGSSSFVWVLVKSWLRIRTYASRVRAVGRTVFEHALRRHQDAEHSGRGRSAQSQPQALVPLIATGPSNPQEAQPRQKQLEKVTQTGTEALTSCCSCASCISSLLSRSSLDGVRLSWGGVLPDVTLFLGWGEAAVWGRS